MKSSKILLACVGVAILFMFGLLFAQQVRAATSFSAGTLLQIGDVLSKHILDGAIVNIDVSGTAGIELSKLGTANDTGFIPFGGVSGLATSTSFKFDSSGKNLYVFTGRIHATSTNFNGVNYTWPSADGLNGYALQTDGAGTLSWAASSAGYLLQSFTAGEAITAGNAVYVKSYQSGGALSINTSASGETTGSSVTSSITVGSNSNRAMLCNISVRSNTSPDTVQYAGQNMTLLDSRQAQTGELKTHAYYLVAPTTGANNFTFNNNDSYAAWACYSLYNVSQSITPATTTYAPAQGSFSQSTTTIAAGYDIFTFVTSASAPAGTYTNINNRQNQDDAANVRMFTGNTTPATSVVSTTTSQSNNLGWHSAIHVQVAPSNPFIGAVYKASASATATSDAFVGFAQSNISQDSSGNIFVAGVASGFTNLLIGTQYYISNTAGALSASAGSNTRKACIAISSTSCQITNIW